MTGTPIGGDIDHSNDRPTQSGGVSGPFRARRGFDAHGHKGLNFEAPDIPGNPANPSGDGQVVQTEFFWDHANFIRWDGRIGALPNPLTDTIIAGEQYAIRMDYSGRFLGRIAVWDGNLSGPAKAQIAPGSVFPVNQIQIITVPGDWPLHDLFLTATGIENAGDFLVNATGADQTITATAHGLNGQVVSDGGSILYLGDSRLGTDGYAILGPADTQFDHTGAAAVGTTPGNWRFLNAQAWIKSLASAPDQLTDTRDGDTEYTIEQNAKELKVWNDGAWHKVYSEVDVRAWIAALSLFEGTVQEVGGSTANVLELNALPDLALNTQIDKIAHYWTWQGSPGYVIQAGDPSAVGRDLPGTILNPGDWLQVSNRSGDVNAPDLHWSHVGGDLLAKSRGDNLYGLLPWSAGGWEIGSLVVHDQSIWRATGPVTATDPAPGEVGAPWQKVSLAGGVRWVSTDGDLPPAGAPAGEIYFVIASAAAGGGGALYYWDAANSTWQPLGGAGGNAMDLSEGYPLLNTGVPIGTVIMWAAANPPPGYLVCDGAAFSAGQYPELAQVLGVTNVPNLVGQFIRGGGAGHPVGTKRGWTTARPRTAFTSNMSGNHRHVLEELMGGNSGEYSSTNIASGNYDKKTLYTEYNGLHSHTITLGGDDETAPDHYCLLFVIKAADIANRVRI